MTVNLAKEERRQRKETHHDDNLGAWPLPVDALDDLGQAVDVGLSRHVVRYVVVVCANVDYDCVGSRALAKVPRLRLLCFIVSLHGIDTDRFFGVDSPPYSTEAR